MAITVEAKTISRRNFLALGAALAGVLVAHNYVPSRDTAAIPETFPGLRFFPGIGVRGNGETWHGNASFAQGVYDRFAAPRERRYFHTAPRSWFIVEKRFLWRELLVDENQAPTSHAEASDPAWSNYKWNHADVIEDMTRAPCMVDNKAKLGLLIAAMATSDPEPVPAWMKAENLTLVRWRGQSSRSPRQRGWLALHSRSLRRDHPEVRSQLEDSEPGHGRVLPRTHRRTSPGF